jgi:excinuclease ABC subunit C
MSSQDELKTNAYKLLEDVRKLPEEPGVYFFRGSPARFAKASARRESGEGGKDTSGEILYIGKATSLRDRVRSYFSNDVFRTRGRLIVDMVALAAKIDFVQTDSVLEALLLEANLIKKHQPKYNTKEKDNKSYNYVVFTNDTFPKVLIIRGRNLLHQENLKATSQKLKAVFGPFPHGMQLKEAMKIIRRIFPYSDSKCTPAYIQLESGRAPRPCFNRQIGLCPGVCTGEISKEEYAEHIKNLKLFFEGKKKTLLKNLEKQMKVYAKAQEFEKAEVVKRQIFALTHIQDIALLKEENKLTSESAGGEFSHADREGVFRIEAYDVAHISGKNVVGVMVVIEDGEMNKSQYRKFKIKINPGVNDIGALKEILRRRLGHMEWPLPQLIAVDGGQAQINAAEAVLKERGFHIPVVSVVKDERHKPREIMGDQKFNIEHGKSILLANSEAHRFAITYHRQKRDKIR